MKTTCFIFISFTLLCSFIFLQLSASDTYQTRRDSCQTTGYDDFETNPYMSSKEREAVRPHLLPLDHPIRPALDQIFSRKRPTLNKESFREAGFTIKFDRPRSFIQVASHPLLKGYLVKAHLDSELRLKRNTPNWKWFVNRIIGSEKIRHWIKTTKSQNFVVPKKWIYPLPIDPYLMDDDQTSRKNEILIVEDMRLVSKKGNLRAWRNVITKKHLKELYKIISNAGGSSYRANNIAYTKKGKFAFIDTEYPNKKPKYGKIVKVLTPKMARYWEKLTSSPKKSESKKKDHFLGAK